MKEFTSSVRARTDGSGANLRNLSFTLDGESYTLRAPKEAQMAYLAASTSASKQVNDRIAGVLDFVEATLMQPGRERLRTRLLDPDDILELDIIVDIMDWAMEEWTGRPPTSAAGSSRQRLNGGRRSKAIASGGDSAR